MKKPNNRSGVCLLLLLCFGVPAFGQRIAPARVQASLFPKLFAFYTNLGDDSLTIHVVGAPAIAKELKKLVGTKMGKATLAGVSESDGPPENGARVVYIAKTNDEVLNYTRTNKCLSITGNPALVKEGVTLGIGMTGDKTVILLNLSSSKLEGIIWNPAILRIAEKVN